MNNGVELHAHYVYLFSNRHYFETIVYNYGFCTCLLIIQNRKEQKFISATNLRSYTDGIVRNEKTNMNIYIQDITTGDSSYME